MTNRAEGPESAPVAGADPYDEEWEAAVKLRDGLTGGAPEDDAGEEAAPEDDPTPADAPSDPESDPPSTEGGDDDGEQGSGEEEADPWASAPAHLRDAFAKKEAELEKARHRINSDDGRVAAMQREIAKLRKQAAEATRPKHDPEKLEKDKAKLREEYPDLAEPVFAHMEVTAAQIEDMKAREQERVEREFDAGVRDLDEAVPGWRDLVNTPEATEVFDRWVDDQPAAIRRVVEADRDKSVTLNPRELIPVFKKFRYEMAEEQDPPAGEQPAEPAPDTQLAQKRKRQKDAAASPGMTSPPARTDEPAPGASYDDEWAAMERKRERERAKRR